MEPIATGAPIGEADLNSGSEPSDARLAEEFANFFVESEVQDLVLEDDDE